jgi:hypothetical protein
MLDDKYLKNASDIYPKAIQCLRKERGSTCRACSGLDQHFTTGFTLEYSDHACLLHASDDLDLQPRHFWGKRSPTYITFYRI